MKQAQILDCNQPITGRRIRLDRLGPQHVDLLLESYSNDEFWNAYRLNQPRDVSRDSLMDRLRFEYGCVLGQVFKLEWLVTNTRNNSPDQNFPIGLACLSEFDPTQMHAEFMIGFFRKEDIRTGLGVETSLLVLDYAFRELGLQTLLSFVYRNNQSALKSTRSLGFKNENLLKQFFQKGASGYYLDVFQSSLSAADYFQSARLSKLSRRLLGNNTVHKGKVKKPSSTQVPKNSVIEAKFTI